MTACLEAATAAIAAFNSGITAGILGEMPDVVLPEVAVTLLRLREQTEAVTSAVIHQVNTTGVLKLDGFMTTRRWLQTTLRLSQAQACAIVARARDLNCDFGKTREAWRAATITSGHVRAVVFGVKKLVEFSAAADKAANHAAAEDFLLQVAAAHAPEDVTRAANRLLAILDQDGNSRSQQEDYDAAKFSLTPVGNCHVAKGVLDGPGGVTVMTALDRIIDQMFRTGEFNNPPVIDPTTGLPMVDDAGQPLLLEPPEGRTPAGKREHYLALALVRLAEDFLNDGKAGTSHGTPAHVNVHVNLTDLIAGTGAGDMDIPGSETPQVIPITTVARMCCDARITTILEELTATGFDGIPMIAPADGNLLAATAVKLQDHAHEVLWLGREHRHVTPVLWKALITRDTHCQFPGCRTDATRGNPHHVKYWWHGGETNIDNLVLICSRHHRTVHEGNWTIVATKGKNPHQSGYWTFTPPPRRRRPSCVSRT